jgi:O-antigen/teichoic acid export membrane protein
MRRGSALPWTLSATMLLSAGGFLFWMLVARRLDADTVGAGASLFSVAFFLVYATNLGVPVLVTRYALDRSPRSVAITSVSLIATAVSGALGAIVFLLISPADVGEPLGGRTVSAGLVMVLLVVSVSVSTVVDARLIASMRLPAHFARLAAVTALRLAGVAVIPASDDGLVLFVVATWAFGATSIVLLPSILRSHSGRRVDHRVLTVERSQLVRFSLSNYLGQLALQGPVFLTPLLVLVAVSPADYSHFYLAWGFASVLLMISLILSQTLLAEASNRGRSDERTLLAAHVGVGLAVGAAIATTVLGRWLATTVYGEPYEPVGDLLPRLMLGCGPATVAAIVVSEARYAERNRNMLLTSLPFVTLVGISVAVGAQLGNAEGAAAGWLIGNLLSLVPSGLQMTRLRSSPATVPSFTS